MKRSLLLLSLLLCLFLGACGGATSPSSLAANNSTPRASSDKTPASLALPDTLQVTRTDLSPTDNLGPFDSTVTDASQVQKLYQMGLALPPFSSGQEVNQACLNDMGVIYHLTFLRANQEAQRMNLDPGDCRLLSLSSSDLRRVDDTFLNLFKQALHLDSLT